MIKLALCGASSRSRNPYFRSIMANYKQNLQIVGVFDSNIMRAEFVRDDCDPARDIPIFDDFDLMVKKTKPDTVLVTTMDSSHHEYIVRSLDIGLDVICEKPMTIHAEGVQAILDAEKRNNRKITVTFNYRYNPYSSRVKELLQSGAIGRVLSIDFEWFLDRSHGAFYFRRWHKWMKNSGGLLLTKATHHFDLINWMMEDDPDEVFAHGALSFYGPNNDRPKGEYCYNCPHIRQCELPFTPQEGEKEFYTNMYYKPSVIDGYRNDACLWRETDIYDNMSLSVKYKNGGLLTYSLHAFCTYEGVRYVINGTKGRMECAEIHRGDLSLHTGLSGEGGVNSRNIRVIYFDGRVDTFGHGQGRGGHGGADGRLLDDLFLPRVSEDPLHLRSTSREGAMSALIGIAGNSSIKSGAPVKIKDLCDVDG